MINLNDKLPKVELLLDEDFNSTVTGTTTEFTHANRTIPAYKLPKSGYLEINAVFSASANSNTKNYRIYFGGTQIKNSSINGINRSINLQAIVYFKNSQISQITPNIFSVTAFGNNSNIPLETTINTTLSQIISIRSKLTQTSNSITLKKLVLKIVRK